jgi:hypothetical protein
MARSASISMLITVMGSAPRNDGNRFYLWQGRGAIAEKGVHLFQMRPKRGVGRWELKRNSPIFSIFLNGTRRVG